jgi:hypothetical protein
MFPTLMVVTLHDVAAMLVILYGEWGDAMSLFEDRQRGRKKLRERYRT